MRLQKTASTFSQPRSVSEQSTSRAHGSSLASPSIEKSGFLATPEPRSPLSPKPQSRPSTRLRNESPPSPPSDRGSTVGTLSPVVAEREQKKSRRRSWFGRSKSAESTERGPAAWVIGHPEQRSYNLDCLTGGERVQELWNESADCEIHLFPRLSGKGSSFRLDSALLASSKLLSELVLLSENGKRYLRMRFTKRGDVLTVFCSQRSTQALVGLIRLQRPLRMAQDVGFSYRLH